MVHKKTIKPNRPLPLPALHQVNKHKQRQISPSPPSDTPPNHHIYTVCQEPALKIGDDTVKCRHCHNSSHKTCLNTDYPSIMNSKEYTCGPCAQTFEEKRRAEKLARSQIAGAQPLHYRPSASKKSLLSRRRLDEQSHPVYAVQKAK